MFNTQSLVMAECDIPVKEIEIPVPWGQISGKVWGDENLYPVFAIHGLMDNCGTFDALVPLLPRNFRFICIDLPGHGRSSHFPEGLPLEFFNYVLSVRMVVEKLKLESFYLMGHSLGAQISIFFSSLYPEKVVKLVCLDGIIPEPMSVEDMVGRCRKRLDNIYEKEEGKSPPSYTYDEALERLLKNRHSPLTEDAARIMIKRSLTPSASGYCFSSDRRLKGYWRIPLTLEQIQQFVAQVSCPLMLVLARETYNKYVPVYGEKYMERLEAVMYGTVNIRIITVEGNHDVHLNHPDRVCHHVASFLQEIKSHI